MGNGPTQVAMACLLAQRVGSPRRVLTSGVRLILYTRLIRELGIKAE